MAPGWRQHCGAAVDCRSRQLQQQTAAASQNIYPTLGGDVGARSATDDWEGDRRQSEREGEWFVHVRRIAKRLGRAGGRVSGWSHGQGTMNLGGLPCIRTLVDVCACE